MVDPKPAQDLRIAATELRELLGRCLELRSPAIITTSDLSAAYHARFSELDQRRRTIDFEILEPVDQGFGGYNSYLVTFLLDGRTWIFISQLRDVSPAQEQAPPRLALMLPSHAVRSDLRQAVRIRVVPECGLEVEMTAEDLAALAPEAVDLGPGGMSIEFTGDRVPDLAPGTVLPLRLRLDGEALQLVAEVRHRDGRRYGLSISAFDDETNEPPPAFSKMLRALERRWFAALA